MNNQSFYTMENCQGFIKSRELDTNKGTYGRVGIVAGSFGMTGSVCMSAMSALRSGSGLVYTIIPRGIADILSIKLTEAVLRPVGDYTDNTGFLTTINLDKIMSSIEDCDCIVLGPGIGTNCETKKVVISILKDYKKPVVLDADGLNCICENTDILAKRDYPTIITPHPREFERLLAGSSIKFTDRIKTSIEFSCRYNVITLLKGYHTVITNTNSDYYINPTGNPGMATAGSGDVLSGIIASFIGQKIDIFNSVCCAAYIHGLAGDIASYDKGEYGMIATDIIDNIPYAIKKVIKKS